MLSLCSYLREVALGHTIVRLISKGGHCVMPSFGSYLRGYRSMPSFCSYLRGWHLVMPSFGSYLMGGGHLAMPSFGLSKGVALGHAHIRLISKGDDIGPCPCSAHI